MLTVQVVAVPVHAPLQPENTEPHAPLAINLTLVPCSNIAEHVAPPSIPAGELVTVPEPGPARVTDNVCIWTTANMNVAVTSRDCVMLTVQVVVEPGHAPLHPENVAPAAAVAVNVTLVPRSNCAEHAAPQSMPAGLAS
jgi:hypothetical protein